VADHTVIDEALLLQSEIVKLKHPNSRVLDTYKHWFQKPYPVLGGITKTALDNPDDLVALNSLPEGDYLSNLLRRHWPSTV
jgi:ABC-type taurine transport system ATPase subunit